MIGGALWLQKRIDEYRFGRYIDIEGTRLSDDDAELLIDFIDNINSYNDIVKDKQRDWHFF